MVVVVDEWKMYRTWEGVVLQDDLVDDTRAGLPEPHAVLGPSRG